jgi:hydrogenase maturation protease
MTALAGPLVIGVGNTYRRDDAAGLEVAALVRAAVLPGVSVAELGGDLVTALDLWQGAAEVYLVDAVCSGGQPGAVYRFDAAAGLPSAAFGHRGTHTFSVIDTIELARALGWLPPRLAGYGIEGADFGAGTGLSPAVHDAVHAVADRLLADLAAGRDRVPG